MFAPLRAVTVDLWHTLITETIGIPEQRAQARLKAIMAALEQLGWPVSEEQMVRAYILTGEEHQEIQVAGRDLTAEAHVSLFLAAIDPVRAAQLPPAQHDKLVALYGTSGMIVPPIIIDGAYELLGTLRAAGLRMALISNTGRTPGRILRPFLEKANLAGFFDVLIFSDEVGLAKPNPEIFALTLQALGVEPSKAAHIGDDPILDLLGAQRSMMRCVVINAERPATLSENDCWAQGLTDIPQLLGIATGD